MSKIKSTIAVVSAAALMLGLGACNDNSSGGETKSLYSQGLELVGMMSELTKSEDYVNVYTPNEDIKNIIAEIGNNDYSVAPKAVYSISISEDDLAALSELNGINNLSDELKDVLSRKTLGAVMTQINGMSGVDNLAAASLCTVGKTFVNENVTEDTIYLYTYENALPVAVTFAVGDDFSVSANGVFVMYEDFTCSSAAEIENFFSEIAVEAKEVAPEK